jgi:hypothetical protein
MGSFGGFFRPYRIGLRPRYRWFALIPSCFETGGFGRNRLSGRRGLRSEPARAEGGEDNANRQECEYRHEDPRDA